MNKIVFYLLFGVCISIAQSRISFKIVPPSSEKMANVLLRYATPKNSKPLTKRNTIKPRTPDVSGTNANKSSASPNSTPTTLPVANPKINPVTKTTPSSRSEKNTVPYFIGAKNFVFVAGKHVYTLPPDASESSYNVSGNTVYLDGKPAYDLDTGEKYFPSYEPPSENPDAELSPLFAEYYVFPGKIVQGKNGKVIIDGVEVFEDDEFEKGHIRIEKIKDELYFNDKLILMENPQKPSIQIPNPRIKTDATEFTIEISLGGFLNYKDNKRANYWYF